MRITSVLGQITSGTPSAAPQQMWPGYADTSSVMFSWWPPPSQTDWGLQPGQNGAPDYYKVYRNGSFIPSQVSPPLNKPGVVAQSSASALGGRTIPWFVDNQLPAGTSNQYTVTAVFGTNESQASPPITMSTLVNGSSEQPAAPINPSTWIVPYALPGGTRWTCTNTSSTAVSGSGTGGSAGCSLGWALGIDQANVPRANINGGDIIVLTAGATYPVPPGNVSGYIIPNFTGTNGFTYIISSQADASLPGFNAAAPQLIPFVTNTTAAGFIPVTCTGAIAVNGKSATLAPNQFNGAVPITDASGRWLLKTGHYYVVFNEPTLVSHGGVQGTQEERKVLFTNGSAAIDWTTLNAAYQVNGVATLGAITGGSGYTNGTYSRLSLTGGSGTGAGAISIVVAGGAVTSITLVTNGTAGVSGTNYVVGDVLSATLPGGSGFSVPVATVAGRGAGLEAQAPANATSPLLVNYLYGVTPTDFPAMATISFANIGNQDGIKFINNDTANCNKVRFVGINVQMIAGGVHGTSSCIDFTNINFNDQNVLPCDHIYFDRCSMGNDDTNLSTWVGVSHGFGGVTCNHFYVTGTYTYGIGNDNQFATGDSNHGIAGGGPHCWENNYMSCVSESMLHGGLYIPPPPNLPHDSVIRWNTSHKPRYWNIGEPLNTDRSQPWGKYGQLAKNHIEYKAGQFIEIYGNLCLNNYEGAIGGYNQAAFSLGPRDQQPVAAGALNNTQCCPWIVATDAYVHDNTSYNVGCPFYCFSPDNQPSVHPARIKFTNNLTYINPLNTTDTFGKWVTGYSLNGPIANLIVDHNTSICNIGNTVALPFGTSPMRGVTFVVGGLGAGTYVHPIPLAPNGINWYQDKLTLTNNILDSGAPSSSAPHVAINYVTGIPNTLDTFPNKTISGNLTINDTTLYGTTPGNTYLPGTTNNVTYNVVGFQNFQGNTGIPTRPSDWNVTTGPNAGVGYSSNVVAPLTITTATLPGAIVGSAYAANLSVSGGTPPYAFNLESGTPNKHLWHYVASNGALFGTPQCDNTGQGGVPDSFVYGVTDATGAHVTKPLTINITTSGALAIVSPATLATGAVSSGWTHQLLASGGGPPYIFWSITGHAVGNLNAYYITNNGWLSIVGGAVATTVGTPDTVTVQVRDVTGATASQVFSITVNATIQLANVDYINGVLKLPPARASHKYRHQLHPCNGGTGVGQTFSLSNGTLPAGLSMTTGGLITGTPTNAGNANCSVGCVDGGSNSTGSMPLALNVSAKSQGTRPAANTASGFFVDTTGQFCDPGGFRFPYFGLNRLDSGGGGGSAWSTSGASAVRFTINKTQFRGTIPANSNSMATYASNAAQHTSLGEYAVMANYRSPGDTVNGSASGNPNLTGDTTATNIGLVAAWWCDNVAAWNAALQNKAGVNPQNEWGPQDSILLQYYYAAPWDGPVQVGTTWKMPITSVNATSGLIQLASTSAAHPLVHAAAIGWVYISGAGMNVAVQINPASISTSAPWTVTATTPSVLSGFTSGTLSGGVIGMLRAAGYTDPLHIDAGAAFGQRIASITAYGPTIAASDPLQNVVLAYHAYNNVVNYTGRVSNVTGSPATIHYNDAAAAHPMSPTGLFAAILNLNVTGVLGVTGINGVVGCSGNALGGTQSNWTTATTVTTSGAYTGGGLVVPGVKTGTAGYAHYDPIVTALVTLQASGAGVSVEEFGNTNSSGGSAGATTMCIQEMVQACTAAQLPLTYWAMDDPFPLGISNGNPAGYTYSAIAAANSVYTTPNQLTATGIDLILNPRYGIHCLASPAPVFLP